MIDIFIHTVGKNIMSLLLVNQIDDCVGFTFNAVSHLSLLMVFMVLLLDTYTLSLIS